MKLASIFIAVLLLPGCHYSQKEVQQVSPPSVSGTTKNLRPSARPQTTPPITEIALERDPGAERANPLPTYALTLRSDGTATYIGATFTPRKGTYRAVISTIEYARLAQWVEASNFASF